MGFDLTPNRNSKSTMPSIPIALQNGKLLLFKSNSVFSDPIIHRTSGDSRNNGSMYAECRFRVQLDLQVTTESHYSRKIYSMIAALKEKKNIIFSVRLS